MHYFKVFIFLLMTSSLWAQSPKGTLGCWLMAYNQTRLTEKWSIHSEVQFRSFNVLPNAEQLLLRGGVNYHLTNAASVTLGYGYIGNWAYDKDAVPGLQAGENRLWQQFLMKNSIGRIFFEHRYRMEERWVLKNGQTTFLPRLRYLFRATIPLNNEKVEAKTVFLTFYDEVFIHINSRLFDRNRLYGAVGYQFTPLVNLQLGYMAQSVGVTTKSYLQLAVNYNLDFRKKEG